ncbi:MAG TPA: hypothetical protein VFV01_33550, partial [Spirillospora sp.]|nr:hypothetical protein [Spirillospora sp.]
MRRHRAPKARLEPVEKVLTDQRNGTKRNIDGRDAAIDAADKRQATVVGTRAALGAALADVNSLSRNLRKSS